MDYKEKIKSDLIHSMIIKMILKYIIQRLNVFVIGDVYE